VGDIVIFNDGYGVKSYRYLAGRSVWHSNSDADN
jgi:hypothetical protein